MVTAYGYDGYHNRIREWRRGEEKRYSYNLLNALPEETGTGYTYDGQGQLMGLLIKGQRVQTMRANALGCRVESKGIRYGLDYSDPYRPILEEKGRNKA